MTSLITETANRIIAGGFDPRRSPWEHRVCVMLITAQGIIDNGGFEYFFENEFEGDTDMSDFPRVYEAIGAESSAAAVKEALVRAANGSSSFDDLNEVMWKDSERNYGLLEAFISAHPANYV